MYDRVKNLLHLKIKCFYAKTMSSEHFEMCAIDDFEISEKRGTYCLSALHELAYFGMSAVFYPFLDCSVC